MKRFPRRWPLFWLADRLAALWPCPRQKAGAVIVRMFGIGDALVFRTVLPAYIEALGLTASEVTLYGSTAWRPIAKLLYDDYRVEFIDERRFSRTFFYRLATLCRIRRHGFATALCGMRFRHPHVTESLILASGAPERIVVTPKTSAKYAGVADYYAKRMTRIIDVPDARPTADGTIARLHEIEHQLLFLGALASDSSERRIAPWPPTSLADILPHYELPAWFRDRRYVVLVFGASYGPRCWPLDRFAAVARRLMARGYDIAFLGGPAELPDRPRLAPLIDELNQNAGPNEGGPRAEAFVAAFDLGTVGEILREAAGVVSGDTGLGHLAILLDTPTVCILGGGHYGPFMPYPAQANRVNARFVHHPMACYHCDWKCPHLKRDPAVVTFPCIDGVSVDAVWDEVAALLPTRSTAGGPGETPPQPAIS